MLELAAELGIPAQLGTVSVADLRRAGEVFITSTAEGEMPVSTLDGAPGELTMRLNRAYWDAQADSRFTTPVDYEWR